MTAYVAIGLAVAHEVVDGLQFTSDRFLAHAWVAVHAAVLVVVLRFRIVEPLRLWLRHGFRVGEVVRERDGSVTVVVTGHDLGSLPALPGQYFRWRFLTRRTWWASHPFSLSQVPGDRSLRMTAKPVGDHTRSLAEVRPGTAVVLEGPYGAVTPALRRGSRWLLVAAGSGIGPLLALAQAGARLGTPVTLVYRVHAPEDALFGAELDELRASGTVDVHVIAGPRHDSAVRRFLNRQVWQEAGPARDLDVYLCGPPGFVADVRRSARTAGVRSGRLHAESFTW
jgi:ferredoxin-NADP reductase